MIGLGAALFFKDTFNILDLIIVLFSIIDMILFNTVMSMDDTSYVVRSIIAFRLMRVLRLARIWKQFQTILQQIKNSMIDTSIFTMLLFVFLFILALLGMELFAYQVFYDQNDMLVIDPKEIEKIYQKGEMSKLYSPVRNFDKFSSAILSAFALFVGDDWH